MYGIYWSSTYIEFDEYYGNPWISNWDYMNVVCWIHLVIHDGIHMGKFIK
nr:MAG TPA: hypothetical protein [Caudoviricetes sp.]